MKTALITGSTRGIGLATARLLAARGVHVVITSRDAGRAENAAREIGQGAAWVALDITNSESIHAAVRKIAAGPGSLDILINNSAILLDHYESILTLDPEVLMQTFATNVVGTLRVTQAFVPLLEKSEDPRIINVSSGAGQLDGEPQAWAPAYSISKTALNMLTQQLTAALPGMMVNSMCPGWCRTEMGGPEAPRSAEEGADTAIWLALDAPTHLRGLFVKDRKVIPW